jgi:hypothetical protein
MVRRVAIAAVALAAALSMALPTSATASGRTGSADWAAHARAVRELHRYGYLVGDRARFDRLKAQAAARAGRLHPGSSPAAPHGPVTGASWKGAEEDDVAPPDTTGAIGPKSYVEFINLQMAIYSRTGSQVADTPVESFAAPGGAHTDYSDPQIFWDPQTRKFFYLIIDLNDDTFAWGFSKSGNPRDPKTGFCHYDADFGYGALLPDYPKLGDTKDFLLIGANIYAGEAFIGSDVDWITKTQTKKAIKNCPAASSFKQGQATMLKDENSVLTSTPEPAKQADPSGTGWVVAVPDPTNSGATGTKLELYKVTKNNDGTANIQQQGTPVTVPMYAPPAPAPQMGTQYAVDTLDGRLTNAIQAVDPAHGEAVALWTQHTIVGGAGAEMRWYEIDVANAATFQVGDITDPNLFVFNGAVSPDRSVKRKRNHYVGRFGSNMVAGFTTSGTAAFTADQMVSKVGSNPVSAFVLVKQSPGPDQGFDCVELQRCRWGDYGGASPDPAAAKGATRGNVWLTNEWDHGDSVPNPLAASWGTWNWEATP